MCAYQISLLNNSLKLPTNIKQIINAHTYDNCKLKMFKIMCLTLIINYIGYFKDDNLV